MVKTKLYINDIDAKAQWGLGLDEGGLNALLAYRPLKEPITNKNVTAEGAVVVCGTGLVDERDVSVPVHIVASGYADFISKRNSFFDTLKSGELTITIKNEWKRGSYTTSEEIFSSKMYYLSCSQYTQLAFPNDKRYNSSTGIWVNVGRGFGIAKFILSLYEPNTPVTEQQQL